MCRETCSYYVSINCRRGDRTQRETVPTTSPNSMVLSTPDRPDIENRYLLLSGSGRRGDGEVGVDSPPYPHSPGLLLCQGSLVRTGSEEG